jgi:HEAT repeat protein
MAKSRKLEDTIALLSEIRADPTSEAGIKTLIQVLNSKYSVAVSQAAKLIGESELHSLIPELVAAFDRFITEDADPDPGCLAKMRIAEALYRLDHSNESLFLQGVRHRQMESARGGKEDTAAALRGACALGLVRMNYSHVLNELADLLADPAPEARIAAARAIVYHGSEQGIPLLRLRVLIGDQPSVISECLVALLELDAERSLPLITQCLYAKKAPIGEDVELAEVAALALGESRSPQAFEILRTWWKQVRAPELRQTGLMAIAMLRHDDAIDFLLSLIADGRLEDSKTALSALGIYRSDAALWQRVSEAVDLRDEAVLRQMLRSLS